MTDRPCRIAVGTKDPSIPAHYRVRYAIGKSRKEHGLDRGKKRKKAMSEKFRSKNRQLEDSIRGSGSQSHTSDAAEEEGVPAKRRRLGADFRMAQDQGYVSSVGRSSRSRTKANLI
jgi:hypothetical protein